jgi:arginyl-tRNA synthetase
MLGNLPAVAHDGVGSEIGAGFSPHNPHTEKDRGFSPRGQNLYRKQQLALVTALKTWLAANYQIEDANVVVEQPPQVAMGDYALPLAFELARRLRKPPRKIAEEIVAGMEDNLPAGFASLEVAGAGYINVRLDRAAALDSIVSGTDDAVTSEGKRVLVEHTSINPNKAAHVGHLRNAILGDTFVRLLKAAGANVSVQNYIDNTGVQVADVVVGLMQLEQRNLDSVRGLVEDLADRGDRIDYYLWDLYAKVSQWYEAEPDDTAARKKLRLDVLHQIEAGSNEVADIADLVATAVIERHLETMQRLDIEYDLLPRESEILHLHFWDAAFAQLKEKGVLYRETAGKNAGCWVMRRAGTAGTGEGEPDEEAKVIVRSNGTVTYVGKDIAYHLWKFGLLGKDFAYREFHTYGDGRECWISAVEGEPEHPHFGDAAAIYNVIDARQSDPQNNVIAALRGLGYDSQADNYVHFSYEMVALTPRCAAELGYAISDEDKARPYIEVSGRKGFGVKADDLLDRMIAAAAAEVDQRHPELAEDERSEIARRIAVGALRYFMLRFTKNAVIAFDFKDALSFEGETGPYAQYACVRAANIFRKAETTPDGSLAAIKSFMVTDIEDDIWDLWLTAAKLSLVMDQCIATTEPAHLAKYLFRLAQQFNSFYHGHHILTEEDAGKKALLLATAAIASQQIERGLAMMGVQVPAAM